MYILGVSTYASKIVVLEKICSYIYKLCIKYTETQYGTTLKTIQSTVLDKGFVKISKAAPLLMPFFLRGAAVGASDLGHRKMIETHGKELAEKGIDPFDLPGRKQDSWIDPTMMYGMGLGLGAHIAGSYGLFGDKDLGDLPLYVGTGLGGAIGAYQTYKKQRDLANDFLSGKKTKDTEYVKTRDYIRDTLEAQKK